MSRLRRTAEGILDDVRLALRSREPTGGMQVPYLGDWAGVVRTPSGARALEQLRRTLEGALDEPGTPVSMLTAEEMEPIRERVLSLTRPAAALYKAELDREALLDHVDALQAQFDAARAEVERLRGVLRTAREALGPYVGNGEHEYEPCGDETGERYAECCECQGESAIETIDAALSETGGER